MKNIFLILTFTLSVNCFATEQITAKKISQIQVYNTYAIARLETAFTNTDNCTHPNAKNTVRVSFDSTAGRELYSTLLSARVSGNPLGFGVAGCDTWGATTVPLVYRIDL